MHLASRVKNPGHRGQPEKIGKNKISTVDYLVG